MYRRDKSPDHSVMDISEIRRHNLRAQIERFGNQAKLADAIDTAESQLSQIIGKNPTRDIGSRQARNIEKKIGLEFGDLDRHPEYTGLVKDVADTLAGLPPAFQRNILRLVRDYKNAQNPPE